MSGQMEGKLRVANALQSVPTVLLEGPQSTSAAAPLPPLFPLHQHTLTHRSACEGTTPTTCPEFSGSVELVAMPAL